MPVFAGFRYRCSHRTVIARSTTSAVSSRADVDDVKSNAGKGAFATAAARCLQYVVIFVVMSADVQFAGSFVISAEQREYCQWENFNASCPSPDEVVLMQSARYGRIRFGRCMREDHGSVGCSADVLAHLDRKCSGRRACHMQIPDATLHGIHPCPKELMPYLEASYHCVKVQGASIPGHGLSHSRCDTATGYQIHVEHGFLAGLTAVEWPRVGTPECPWVLRAPHGRRFNLSLYSFFTPPSYSSVPPASATSMGRSSIGLVQTAAGAEDAPTNSGCSLSSGGLIVFDGNRTTALPICIPPGSTASTEGGHREHRIYSSDGHTLRLFLQSFSEIGAPSRVSIGTVIRGSAGTAGTTTAGGGNQPPVYTSPIGTSFLIRFQAFGCADMTGLPNAVVRRYGDSVSVRCSATGETYFLTCIESRWVGELSNCSSLRGILLVIGLGVAIGVAFGVVLLFGLLLCFRSRRDRRCFKSGLAGNDQPLLMSLNGQPGSVNCAIEGRLETTADERLIDFAGRPPSGSSPCCGTELAACDDNESERYFVNRQTWHSTRRNPRVNADADSITQATDAPVDGIEAGRRRLCPFHQLIQLSSTSLTTTSMLPSFRHPAGTYVSITAGQDSDDACGRREGPTSVNHAADGAAPELPYTERDGKLTDVCYRWSDRENKGEELDNSGDDEDDYDDDDVDGGVGDVEQSGKVEITFDGSATLDLIRSSSTATSVTIAPSSVASEGNGGVESASGLYAVAENRRYLSSVSAPRRPTVSWNDGVGEKSTAVVASKRTSTTGTAGRSLNV